MAIAFDSVTATAGTASGVGLSHTTSAGSNRYMLIGIGVNNGVTVTVTYNGVSATIVGTSQDVSPGGETLYLYRLINPASGANNVVVTTSDTLQWEGAIATYTGVSQNAPEASNKGGNLSSPITATLTTLTDNAWLAGFFRNGSGNNTAGANTTVRGAASALSIADTNADQTPVGSKSLNITFTGGGVCGWIAVSLAPVQALTITAAVGAFVLTGFAAGVGFLYTLAANVGNYLLTGYDALFTLVSWSNQSKSTSTFTGGTKHSSTYSNQAGTDSTWTNRVKND